MGTYNLLANAIVCATILRNLPIHETEDWDKYRQEERGKYPSELRAIEEWVFKRITNVKNSADRQRAS